ncbi:YlqD family protein [Thermaerobacillus caldiproteolyticus]|uniref:YlqD family protein n=1 Tax=Thermaerobacillus caldiproteolyticus TaxID=247480 RepID=UPI00188B4E2F|nr:YlqD family protein [Anoxybacillus caldiproteolyticus]QPA32029.1 YlqD family protein [Anoxybacillus caldiproteolyticus]
MKIIQTVEVKQIVTEKSKQVLQETFMARKQQLQRECDQLRFEQKRLEKTSKHSPNLLKQYFTKEIDARLEKIKLLDFQLEQLHILPLGSELKERDVQALIEVNVGDRWEDITAKRAIIIEDGIVKEIR